MTWLRSCCEPELHYRVLYFAYGSNLDDENWSTWCAKRGYSVGSIEPLGPAWLPDHELVFHYRSRLRNGGALDIRPRHGTTVPGALFRVHDWAGLDAKEGVAGRYYQRVSLTALTDDGRAHAATSYRVCDDRLGDFVAPGPEYRQMVTRGLSRFGHGHEGFVAAAANDPAPFQPTSIFVYGTLMRGQRSHDKLSPRIGRAQGDAHVVGAALIHIEWYPGLVLSEEGRVHGELYEIDDLAEWLAELDSYEDFCGYDSDVSLYRRSLVRAVANGDPTLAWAYVYLGDPDPFPRIPSGRWAGA